MIVVLTSLTHDAALLPQFVEHYFQLGAEQIHCSVLELVPNLRRRAIDLVGEQVVFHDARAAAQENRIEGWSKHFLRVDLGLDLDDWYVPADIDEFVDFGANLHELTASMQAEDYAMGRFVDRVATSGKLTKFDRKLSLAEQYPRRTSLTRELLKLDDRKVVLCRGGFSVGPGHHRMVDESRRRSEREFDIDHYAWREGRIAALERRWSHFERVSRRAVDRSPIDRLKSRLEHGGLLATDDRN